MAITGDFMTRFGASFLLQPSSGTGGGRIRFGEMLGYRSDSVYGYGTGAGRFNRGYYFNSTHTGSTGLLTTAARSLDLQTQADRFNVALGLTSCRYFGFISHPDNLYGITFVPNAANGWLGAAAPLLDVSDKITVLPGQALILDLMGAPAGYTVSASSKVLDIANVTSSTQHYEMLIIGQA